ncbi:alkaline phosphatase D family protein [Micromonospora sp. DT201]|uniref:alkaline phosphatase D family protein n=1 Tax=Micromonospora sp. DT201 TaxID=3393442 RepID=UPI003CF614F3
MAELNRRQLLKSAVAAGIVPLVPAEQLAQHEDPQRPAGRPTPFLHGVASGDPLPDRVILWTRLTLPAGRTERARATWVVAKDPELRHVVREGSTYTDASRDWTVKVDADRLKHGTTYYYAFSAEGARSEVGRTRTAVVGSPDAVRLAVVTCGDYTRGLFNAYGRLAERDDIDAVVHLGDYIYEGDKQDKVRPHIPAVELRTLAEYRGRYASYRLDANLAKMHRRHPMIWVWDDHETCDGTWRDGADPKNHDPAEDGPFSARKLAARQAAFEWLPIRLPDPRNPERIYRNFAFGNLVDLIMLDTRRIGRDRQGEGNVGEDAFTMTGVFADPARQILGKEQERWFLDSLRKSKAAWRIVGNQVMFSQLKAVGATNASNASVYTNPDQWDGYGPARDRVFDVLENKHVDDVVIVTGDVHASLALEVTRDPNNPAAYDPATSKGAVAVEFVAPSISSAGDPEPEDERRPAERLVATTEAAVPNPHLKYVRSGLNGYLLLDINRKRVEAEYWLVPFVGQPTDQEALDRSFTVPRGRAALVDRAAN